MAESEYDALARHLRSKPGVVLQAYPSLLVLRGLQSLVAEVTLNGGNVVLLIDAPRALVDPELLAPWRPLLDGAYLAEKFHEGNAFLGTVSRFSDALRDSEYDAWVERIGLLLLPRGEDIFTRPYAWKLMAFALRDRFASRGVSELPRTVVVLEPRRKPESAIRDALPIYATAKHAERDAWTQYKAPVQRPEALWWTVWSSEAMRGYVDGLLAAHPPQFCGATGPLAQFAGRWGVPAALNWVFFSPDSGDVDHHQNLQSSVQRLLFEAHAAAPWQWLAKSAVSTGSVTVGEPHGNPWRSLRRVMAAFNGTTLCNIVCRSDMLFPYQVANAQYFSMHPLLPLSPMSAMTVPFDTAVQLVQRLDAAGSLPAKAVRDALVATDHPCAQEDPEVVDVYRSARMLVEAELGPEIAAQLRWGEQHDWGASAEGGAFACGGSLRLDGSRLARASVSWLDEFEVAVEGGTVFDVVRREHVMQRYWPGKVVLLEGQKFVVDKVDERARRVQISHSDEVELPDYRLVREVTLSAPAECKLIGEPGRFQLADGACLLVEPFTVQFEVTTERVLVSQEHWTNAPRFESVPRQSRRYRAGRAARLTLTGPSGTSLLPPSAAVALAAWLNEAALSLLPEVSNFFLAAPLVAPDSRPKSPVAAAVVPSIQTLEGANTSIAVWIFEDSQSDLGIMRSALDGIWYLLDVCFDWLNWTLDEAADAVGEPVCLDNLVRPPRDWLSYGMESRDTSIGLADLRESLRTFKDEFREVTRGRRQARAVALLDDRERLVEATCDICHCVLSGGTPFDVFRDGRISCKACSAIGLVHLVDLERIFHEVAVPFFRERHQIVDVVNVRVELVDQAEISDAQGKRFIPTSGFDTRAIGLAMKDAGRLCSATVAGQDRHVVLIESGFSPEATANTLVHELCHVWQYNHVNLGALDTQTGQLYIEGHAVWTEATFLEWVTSRSIGQFKQERWPDVISSHEALKNGDTVYGEGFRLVNGHLSLFDRSAFDWLRSSYPRS